MTRRSKLKEVKMLGSYLVSVLLAFGHLVIVEFEFCRAQEGPSINYNGETPASNPVVNIKTMIHCIDSGLPVLLGDPFDPSERDEDSFVFMEWGRVSGDEDKSMVHFLPTGEATINDEFQDKVSVYQNWGIQISSVTFDDSAIYRASIKRTTTPEERNFKVIVARAPKLASQKLTVTSQKKDERLVLRCGEVESLGRPPVDLEWQDKDGLKLNSTYSDGYLLLELNTTADLDEEYFCLLDQASPASECIPALEKDLWDTSFNIAQSTSGAGLDSKGVIIGVVVTVILLLIIVVIAFCISRRRKNAYNTKKGEKKKVEEVNSRDPHEEAPLNTDPEDYEDQQEAPRIPSKVKNTSPYMVSNVNPANVEASHYASSPVSKTSVPAAAPMPLQRQQRPAPVVPFEESNVQNGGGGGDPPAPKPKPRSRYFNSQEDLTQIGQERGVIPGSETCV